LVADFFRFSGGSNGGEQGGKKTRADGRRGDRAYRGEGA
jgi:hypothetical protein